MHHSPSSFVARAAEALAFEGLLLPTSRLAATFEGSKRFAVSRSVCGLLASSAGLPSA